jgi:hypothetical protein
MRTSGIMRRQPPMCGHHQRGREHVIAARARSLSPYGLASSVVAQNPKAQAVARATAKMSITRISRQGMSDTTGRPFRPQPSPRAPWPAHRPLSQPIRADYRARLVAAIARGRLWLSQIETGAVNGVTEIAIREDCSPRHVNMTISLAFLAPSLVKAAVEGRLPHGIGLARLLDAPAEWDQQHRMLGLAS